MLSLYMYASNADYYGLDALALNFSEIVQARAL